MKGERAMRLGRAVGARLTYANVVATIGLFLALGAGSFSVASHLRVRSSDIVNNAVRAKHIKKSEVKSKHVAAGAVGTGKLGDGAVTATKLANGAVTSAKLAPGVAAAPWDADCNQGLAPDDVMVRVGSVCIDRYEASVWDARVGGNRITGALPCNDNGQGCTNIYARSVVGVPPRRNITWLQAQQALANSGKRLPTNAEWQMAAAGTTPDTGAGSTPCNTRLGQVLNTGSNNDCISSHGVNDMVGNLWEWVADWDEQAVGVCANWPSPQYGGDISCIGRVAAQASTRFPSPLVRGGSGISNTSAGPFALDATVQPSHTDASVGFRGAR